MADSVQFVQTRKLTLSGSGCSSTATSIILTSLKLPNGATNIAMSDFGTLGFITLEPGTVREENISFTGVTQNGDGTATLTGVTRGLNFVEPYTNVPAFQYAHAGGSVGVISNSAPFLDRQSGKDNDETISGDWDFSIIAPSIPTMTSGDTGRAASIEYANALAIAGSPDSTLTVKGIVEIGTTADIDAGTTTGATGASLAVRPDQLAASIYNTRLPSATEKQALVGTSGTPSSSNKYVTNDDTTGTGSIVRSSVTTGIQKFGGTGSDGALSISSGTTTINLGATAYVEKNYTSISITGTGVLAFSNPHANGTTIVLRSQGNVTLTSSTAPMLDASGMGAATLTQAASLGESASTIAAVGTVGSAGANASGGAAGAAYSVLALELYTDSSNKLLKRIVNLYPGSGGATGANGYVRAGVAGTGGAGGRGGGALYVECAGALNFTTASGISVAGASGSNGTTATGTCATGGGGGSGGRGGMFVMLYNTLTANSGTVNISSGAGGNGGNGITAAGADQNGSGGGGGSTAGGVSGAGTGGGDGVNAANGNNGSSGSGGGGGGTVNAPGGQAAKTGGTGGTALTTSGISVVAQNNWFA